MPKNRNYLPDDWLAIFENRVRSVGVWCDVSVSDKFRHKFVARNPNSMLAISLCGVLIRSIEKLHENHISQKCLICELYDTGPKEVKNKLLNRLDDVVSKTIQPETTNKE